MVTNLSFKKGTYLWDQMVIQMEMHHDLQSFVAMQLDASFGIVVEISFQPA